MELKFFSSLNGAEVDKFCFSVLPTRQGWLDRFLVFFFVFGKHKEIAIDMCDLLLDFCVGLIFCLKFSGRNIMLCSLLVALVPLQL